MFWIFMTLLLELGLKNKKQDILANSKPKHQNSKSNFVSSLEPIFLIGHKRSKWRHFF